MKTTIKKWLAGHIVFASFLAVIFLTALVSYIFPEAMGDFLKFINQK